MLLMLLDMSRCVIRCVTRELNRAVEAVCKVGLWLVTTSGTPISILLSIIGIFVDESVSAFSGFCINADMYEMPTIPPIYLLL